MSHTVKILQQNDKTMLLVNFQLSENLLIDLMKQDKTKGRSGPMKRIKVAINLDYLAELLSSYY